MTKKETKERKRRLRENISGAVDYRNELTTDIRRLKTYTDPHNVENRQKMVNTRNEVRGYIARERTRLRRLEAKGEKG